MKGDRKARGLAAFDKKRKSLRLAATTAKRHKIARPGQGQQDQPRAAQVPRPRARRSARAVCSSARRAGAVVFGSRKGKVTYVALVDRRVAKSRRKTRAVT